MIRSFATVAGLVAAVGCWFPRSGEGATAERGYARAGFVIAALDEFVQRTGFLPDSLGQLVPDFLPAAALEIPVRAQERYPLVYWRFGRSYSLEFRYVGPGMNQCVFLSSTRKWQCAGHY